MREILFRGKRTENGKWVEGSLLTVTLEGQTFYLIFGDDFERSGVGVTAHEHSNVIAETVGQYTGLKDSNGKRIFEGDMVTIPNSKKQGLPACVRYNKLNATFEAGRNGFNSLSLWGSDEIYEVVGNIHDNPELMGGGK